MRRAPVAITLVVIGVTACSGSKAAPVARPTPSPSATSKPVEVALPTLAPDALAVRGADGRGVQPALAAVADAVALPGAAVLVVDASTGKVLLDRRSGDPEPPASTTKLLTAVAALSVLGPQTQLATRAEAATVPDPHGLLKGDLVLVGAGDPTLTTAHVRDGRASLQDLAAQIKSAGVRHITGRVLADTSLFTADTSDPGWQAGYVSGGSVAPVQSLEVDGGRITPGTWITPRVANPALTAAADLVARLRADGVTVDGGAALGGPLRNPVVLTQVEGFTISQLVTRMLQESDNDLAEALGRLVSIADGQPGSSTSAGSEVVQAVHRLGVPVTGVSLSDTSGLSTLDRLTGRTLVGVLRLITEPGHADLRVVLRGLPVAGVSGTLADRFLTGGALSGKGKVRAKTGAISGVSTLAGVVPARSGRLMLFSFAMDGTVSRATAEASLDAAAGALARVP